MNVIVDNAPQLIRGLWITLLVFALGSVLTIFIAFVAGLARLSRLWFVRVPAAVFVEVFRGTSLVVQMFFLFFALPLLGLQLSPITAGVLALGLNEGAYAAEVVRGAIHSRPRGQTEACIALSIPPAKRMRRILIPQSIPAMLPPFGNVLVDLLKNTSLVALVTVADLTFEALSVRTNYGHTTAVFGSLLVVYFVLSLILSGVMKLLERRFAIDRKTQAWNPFRAGVPS